MKPGAYNPFSAEQRKRYMVFMLESAIKKMETSKGTEKLCWILDFSEFGERRKSPESKQVSKNSSEILQNHYPERLGLAFVVNAPWYMYYLYKAVSIFMSASTKSKIRWVNGSTEELGKQLMEFISEDQLEIKYGGKNDAKPIQLYESTSNNSLEEIKYEDVD
jgi:hypothetical protein